jgi:hypothetical protein
MASKSDSKQAKISKVEITDDKISGRGGLFFVLRFIENIGFYTIFENLFGFVKGSRKGLPCSQIIQQILAFFIDGTNMSISSFDKRKNDKAYAATLENTPDQMASSHQIKRFFRKFITIPNWIFRQLLLWLFIWRLNKEKPTFIVLFADSMVLDNNDAEKREGVEPTYKGKKGFHPLQISWGPYIVDAIFRTGSPHCNHGNDLKKAIGRLVNKIRQNYAEVPIIVLTDSGFMDDKNFTFFEERLRILYICVGKRYEALKQYIEQQPAEAFSQFCNPNQSWNYIEFGNRLDTWSKFRRCIFTTLETEENGQMEFEFVKTDVFIYTNIGMDEELTEKLVQAGGAEYLQADKIISLNHFRGKGELVHRSFKDFAVKEQLPFEKLGMNRAYYYFMVVAHFLYECYKRDVVPHVVGELSYPSTFRRELIDFAAKIVSSGRYNILKVSKYIFEVLNIPEIWERSGSPHPIVVI